jgi:hypothetical protein
MMEEQPTNPQTDFRKLLLEKKYYAGRGTKKGGTARNVNSMFKTAEAQNRIGQLSQRDAEEMYQWITKMEQEQRYVNYPQDANQMGTSSVESKLIKAVNKIFLKNEGLEIKFDETKLFRPEDYELKNPKPDLTQDKINEETTKVLEQSPSNPNTPASNLVLPENLPLRHRPHAQKTIKLMESLKATKSQQEAAEVLKEAIGYYKSPKLEAAFTKDYEKHLKFLSETSPLVDPETSFVNPLLNPESEASKEQVGSVAIDSNTFQQAPVMIAADNTDPTDNTKSLKPFVVSQQSPEFVKPPEEIKKQELPIKTPKKVQIKESVKTESVESVNAKTKMQEAIDAAKEEQGAKASDASIGSRYKVGLDTYTATARADIIQKPKEEQKKSIHTYADRTWVYSIQDSRLGNASSLKKLTDMENKRRYETTYQLDVDIPDSPHELIKKNKKFLKEKNNYRLTPLNQHVEITDRSYFSSKGNQQFGERHVGNTPDTNQPQSGNYWDIYKNPPKQDLGLSPMFERSQSRLPDRYKNDRNIHPSVAYDTFDEYSMEL